MRKFKTDESDTILEFHYENEAQQLMAFFKNGSAYLYSKVTLEDFGKIISQESIGRAFNEFTKNHTIGYRRIR